MAWARRLRSAARPVARHPLVRPFAKHLLKLLGRDGKHGSTVTRPQVRQLSGGDDGLSHALLLHAARNLPVSNGSRYARPIPLRVAIVTDVYMFNFYRDCFEQCIYVNPDNVEDVIAGGFDVLLYVTCWAGVANDEWRGILHRERPMEAFGRLIEHCDQNDVPTIFQSIEDPSNFDYFLPIARKCRYVFTSDTGSIKRYRQALGHDRVFHGEYGVNPMIGNPIGSARPPLDAAFFAGSFPARYPERCTDMEVTFSSIVNAGARLVIADRNFGSPDETLRFPPAYRTMIIDRFDHDVLQRVHKLFRYNLNFNSIKDSATMCAMRVYELQSLGRGIFSNYARSVFNTFPAIKLVPEPQDLSPYFRTGDDGRWQEYRRNMDSVLDVLTDRTSLDVARRMMQAAGLAEAVDKPAVAVIAAELTPAIEAAFGRQTYPRKHLVSEAQALDPAGWSELRRRHGIDYVAVFDADAFYGARYLDSLLNAFKYTACRYATKGAHFDGSRFVEGVQHEYTEVVNGSARSVFAADDFSMREIMDIARRERSILAGGYAVDPFELDEEAFFAARRGEAPASYALSIVIPVYNNGQFLVTKCLESLQRSERWAEMEILLVDDGSTDGVTPGICERLVRLHANVSLFRFEPGGSGSASRPRNKGIELATAPLVTFLDPDNEICIKGYDVLMDIHREQVDAGAPVDFVCGYHVKVGLVNTRTGLHAHERCEVAENPRARFFERGRFPVVSTQAAVIDRRFLLDSGLRFVEGAAGQDTLFGWQLLGAARRVAFTNAVFLLYYHERDQSVTNHVNARYFEKMKILEREQIAWLEQQGLLETYVAHHLDGYVRNWYLKQLDKTHDGDVEQARQTLRSIVEMYRIKPETYSL